MTDNPTERAARATTAAKISTASKSRDTEPENPGVGQPATVDAERDSPPQTSEESNLRGDIDAQEKAHLGDGTAR